MLQSESVIKGGFNIHEPQKNTLQGGSSGYLRGKPKPPAFAKIMLGFLSLGSPKYT